MKLLILIAAGMMAVSAGAQTKLVPGDYKIDPMHSKATFNIPHLVISSVDGIFKDLEGSLDLKGNFDKSAVKASIDVNSIDTGVQKRDDHLRSPDFFDVKKYPKMTFKSAQVTGTPDDFKLTGDLTIKGVTKKVTFEGKYLGAINDGMGSERAAFTATTKINRKDFGLVWNKVVEAGPVVGDELTINLRIEAIKPVGKVARK